MPHPKQFGLIEEKILRPKDWRFGGVTGIDHEILKEDGDYSEFIIEDEKQIGVYFDTLGCVSFSALNCLETIAKVKGIDWNKSDRFTAKSSGTTEKGNSLHNVAESIQNDGTVPEESWPWKPDQRQPIYEWEDFYAEIPDEVKYEGKAWLKDWGVKREWFSKDKLDEGLRYGPLQVTVQAWPRKNEDGFYENTPSIRYNHAVELIKKTDEYCLIRDHYKHNGTYLKKLPPDYKFGSAMLYTLTKKKEDLPIMDIPNDTLVQEVEESGTFGMHLDNKIFVDEPALILSTWLMRNNGNGEGKVQPLTKEQWDSFPKCDLKSNPI